MSIGATDESFRLAATTILGVVNDMQQLGALKRSICLILLCKAPLEVSMVNLFTAKRGFNAIDPREE